LSSIGHHIGLIQNYQLHVAIANSSKMYVERAFVSANFLIYSRTTLMPRSSLAFSYITMLLKSFLYNSFATATIVEVLPVPGGP
jgi:hypothetical protein